MMKRARQVACATVDQRVVDQNAIPLDALFEPWELADWTAINKAVAAGKVIHIEDVSGNDEEHWVGCALRELGRQNVYVQFCYIRFDDTPTYGLWIVPRAALKGVLTEEYERVHT